MLYCCACAAKAQEGTEYRRRITELEEKVASQAKEILRLEAEKANIEEKSKLDVRAQVAEAKFTFLEQQMSAARGSTSRVAPSPITPMPAL